MLNKATLKPAPVVSARHKDRETQSDNRFFVNNVEELSEGLFRALNSHFEVKF